MTYDEVADKIKKHARKLNQVLVSIVVDKNKVLLVIEVERHKYLDKIATMPDQSSAIMYAGNLRDELVDDFEFVKNVIITARRRIGRDVESKDYVLISDKKGVPHITLGKLNRIYLKGDFAGQLGISPGTYLVIGYNTGEDTIAIHKTFKDIGAFRVADRMYITAAKLFKYCEFNERFKLEEEPRTYYLDAAASDSSVAIFRAN